MSETLTRLSSIERDSSKEKITIEQLSLMSAAQLMDLFKTLPKPNLLEMEGELKGHYLRSGNNIFVHTIWYLMLNSQFLFGRWEGKSFKLLAENDGYGFNNFDRWWMKDKRWPMRISIEPSRYDNKESLEVRYRHYFSLGGIVNMRDEFRQLNDDYWLGVALWKLPFNLLNYPVWFVMEKPFKSFDNSGV